MDGFEIAPLPPGFVPMEEEDQYYPVGLITAYRPGGDWGMGLDPGVEGQDLDAYDTPILGRSTYEDYIEGNAEYVTVAMDKASSWQNEFLKSPEYPGVVFRVRDNGGFGNNKTGNDWIDIAFRDPEKAKSFTAQGIPFAPISEEEANEIRSQRAPIPEGFIPEKQYVAQQSIEQTTKPGISFPGEEDRIPLEGEVPPLPEGFVPMEQYEAQQAAQEKPSDFLDPALVDRIKQERRAILDQKPTIPENWSQMTPEGKTNYLRDFQAKKDQQVAEYDKTEAAKSPVRADLIGEFEGETPVPVEKIPLVAGEDFLQRLRAVAAAPMAGATGALSGLMKTLSLAEAQATGHKPEETWLKALADQMDKNWEDIQGPYRDEVVSQIVRGAGTSAAFIPAAVAGGLPGVALMGAAEAFGRGYYDSKEQARSQGKEISEEQAYANALLTAGLGSTEAIPFARYLNKLNKATKGSLQRVIDAGVQGAEEFTQEFFQSSVQDFAYSLQNLSDKDWKEILVDASKAGGVGGLSGLLIGLTVGALHKGSQARPAAKPAAPAPAPAPGAAAPPPVEVPGAPPTPAPAPGAEFAPPPISEQIRRAPVYVEGERVTPPPTEPAAAPAPEEAPSIVGQTVQDIAPRDITLGPSKDYVRKRKAEGATVEQAAAELREEGDRVIAQITEALPPGSQIRDPVFGIFQLDSDGVWRSTEGKGVKGGIAGLEPDSVIVRVGRGTKAAPATQGRVKPGEFGKKGYTAIEPAAVPTAEEMEGTEEPSTTAEAEALIAKYQGMVDERSIAQRKPAEQREQVNTKGRENIVRQLAETKALEAIPVEDQPTITQEMFAIEDMVGADFNKLGIPREVRRGGTSAGIAYDALGNLTLVVTPETLYRDEMDARKGGAPKGLLSRLVNGEELIHAADLIGLRNEWLKSDQSMNFVEFMRDKTLSQLRDMKGTLEETPTRQRKPLQQALRDSWNIYYERFKEDLPEQLTPEEFLDNMIRLSQEADFDTYKIPISWLTEFVRQAKQLERQGTITESTFRKVYDVIKDWVTAALRRIKKSLPGAQEGKYGKAVKQRLQNIDDILAGKVTGVAPQIYQATPEERAMIAERKAKPIRFVRSTKVLTELAKSEEAFKDWYGDFADALHNILGQYREYAPLITEILAATSPSNEVKANVTRMLQVLEHYINTGEPLGNLMESHKQNVERALRGEVLSGPKVGPFSEAMHGDVEAMAIDRHVAMLLFNTKAPSVRQIEAAKRRIRQIAQQLGWTPREAQAAIWAANIRRQGAPIESYERAIETHKERLYSILAADRAGEGRGIQAARRIGERISQAGGIAGGRGGPSAGPAESLIAERRGREPVAPAPTFGPTVARGIDRLWLGAANLFDKTPALRPLAEAIRHHVDLRRALPARFGTPFRRWLERTKGGRLAAQGANMNYWRADDNGRAAEAAKVKAAATPEGKDLIDTATKVLNDMWDMAEKEQYKIRDPITGRYKPFRKGARLWPRMIKEDILETFRNPTKRQTQWKALRDELVNGGHISKTNANAEMQALGQKVLDLHKTNDVMSNVEMLRRVNLPEPLYDYSFEAIRRYVSNFSEALARKIALGQKIGTQGKDVFDIYKDKAGDEATRRYIELIQHNAYNDHYRSPAARAAMVIKNVAAFNQLANPRSVERNWFTGTAFTAGYFGPLRTLRQMASIKLVFDSIEDAKQKGAIVDDIMQIMSDGETIAPKSTKLAQAGFTYSGWNAVEHYLRGVSFAAAKSWLRYTIRQNQKNPTGRASRIARGRLQRMGIDANKLFLENGDGPLTDRFFRAAVAEVQYGYQYDQVPGFVDSPEGRFWLQYRKFATQAMQHFDREVARPFARAVSLGTAAQESIKIRDPVTGKEEIHRVPGQFWKGVAFLTLMALAGAGEEWFAEQFFGIPAKQASMAEIMSRMKRDQAGAIRLLLGKIFGYVVNAGATGLLGDALQYGVDYAAGRTPRAVTDVPGFSMFLTGADMFKDILEAPEYTGRAVDRFLTDVSGAYRVGGQALAKAANAAGIEQTQLQIISRRQDMSWLRGVTRRFNDEMGVEKKGGMPADVRLRTSADTAFRAKFKEYLLIGDIKSADKLMTDHFARWSPERQEIERDNLEQSVSQSQPINAGYGGGNSARAIFLEWAEGALSKAEYARVLDIDETYRDSARALGIWDPKPPKAKDIQKTKRRIQVLAEPGEEE